MPSYTPDGYWRPQTINGQHVNNTPMTYTPPDLNGGVWDVSDGSSTPFGNTNDYSDPSTPVSIGPGQPLYGQGGIGPFNQPEGSGIMGTFPAIALPGTNKQDDDSKSIPIIPPIISEPPNNGGNNGGNPNMPEGNVNFNLSPPSDVTQYQSQLNQLFGIQTDQNLGAADPVLQQRLYDAERGRLNFNEINLEDINQSLYGTDSAKGILEMNRDATLSAEDTRAQIQAQKGASDIAYANQYGQGLTDSIRGSDADLNQIRQNAQNQANGFTGNAGFYQGELDNSRTLQNEAMSRINLNPEMRREAEQEARATAQAYGRSGDNSSIAAEILNREKYKQQARAEAAGAINNTANLQGLRNADFGAAQGQAFGFDAATSAAPGFQNLFGQQSNAQTFGVQGSMMGQNQLGNATPQLYNPDSATNLDLTNQANKSQYDATLFGSSAALAGANSAANASLWGGILGGLGSIGAQYFGNK